MPIVDTKKQEKHQKGPQSANKEKKLNFLLGTAIPNSTIKANLISTTLKNKPNNPAENYNTQNVDQKTKSGPLRNMSKNLSFNKMIPSGQKLQELTELHNKLVNPLHEPVEKKRYEPRRPTMEAIKSAIEKAKLMELATNKSVGTDDNRSSVTASDASTQISTGKGGKKKIKKKYKIQSISTTTTATTSTTTKPKKASKSSKKKIRKSKKTAITVEARAETKA